MFAAVQRYIQVHKCLYLICKSSIDITSCDAYHKVTTSLLYVFVGIDFARARPVDQTDSHTHPSY